MILKNDTKDYIKAYVTVALVIGLCCSVYGAFIALNSGVSIAYTIVAFIICGIFIGTIWFITLIANAKRVAKNAKQLSHQVAKVRTIICQGQGNYRQAKRKVIGGWMFLTEDAVEFYGVKGKQQGYNIAILLDDIISVSTKRNSISITTAQQIYLFGVAKPDVWKEEIGKAVDG